MSGSIPAWKQAIYDRKKQQQKEEELKQAEKEAYLASLPPWKRALFLKKEKDAAGTANKSSQQGTVNAATKSIANQQQSTTINSASTQSKPTTTATSAVAGSAPPVWKRKESPINKNDLMTKYQQANVSPPVNTNANNNREKSPSFSKISPAVDTRPETPAQKETLTAAPATVSGTDNIPLWKRNLLQRQAAASANTSASGDKNHQPVNLKVTDTPRTSVAIGSSKTHGKSSDVVTRSHIPSQNTASGMPNVKNIESTSPTDSRQRSKSVGPYDDYDDKRLASLPPWKRDLILRKRAAAAAKEREKYVTEVTEPSPVVKVTRRESIDKDRGWKKTIHKPSEDVPHNLMVKRLSNEKISMWQKAAAEQIKPVKRASQEIDPESQPIQHKTSGQEEIQPAAASQNIPLANGPEKEENDESAPPILKGRDPWAHVSENDPQFKALPPWKQALILRRRGDIQRRSNPEIHMDRDSSSVTMEADDEPDFGVPAWKREAVLKKSSEKVDEVETMPEFDDPDMPEWKKEKLRKSFQDKKKSRSQSLPVLVSKKQISHKVDMSAPEWKKEKMDKHSVKNSDDDDIPEWKKEKMKEKQILKKNNSTSDIPEWKKEAMGKKQTIEKNDTIIPKWKKEAEKQKNDSVPLLTRIRPLSPDEGSPISSPVKQYSPQPIDVIDYQSSNHIDDDDDDDVPCTNIDDLSDSDESVEAFGSYDVNPDSVSTRCVESTSSGYSSSSDNNSSHGLRHQKSSKSILVIKKTSNPVSEH